MIALVLNKYIIAELVGIGLIAAAEIYSARINGEYELKKEILRIEAEKKKWRKK